MRTMIVRNERTLESLGQRTGQRLLRSKKHQRGRFASSAVIALSGPLGAGKTTFLRGFARGLGIRRRLTSPTFILARRYRIPKKFHIPNSRFPGRAGQIQPRWFWHLDVYRLRGHQDLAGLDFSEILEDPANIVAIEWAEKIKKALPKRTTWMRFSHHSKGRTVHFRKPR